MWHVILNGNSCACRQEAGEHCLFPDNFATNKPTGITQVHVTYLHGMPPALELSLLPAIMSFCPGNSTDSHSGNYRSLPMGKHVALSRKWKGSSAGNQDTAHAISWVDLRFTWTCQKIITSPKAASGP